MSIFIKNPPLSESIILRPLGSKSWEWKAISAFGDIKDIGIAPTYNQAIMEAHTAYRQMVVRKATAEPAAKTAPGEQASPIIPMLLHCPECHARHIDTGPWATKPHHTHACQNCGHCWRPAVMDTVGVEVLPGFVNEPEAPAEAAPAASEETHRAVQGWLPRKGPVAHYLKAWLEPFRRLVDGSTTFEWRCYDRDDRDYRGGDILILQEFDQTKRIFTGRITTRKVTHMMRSPHFGALEGYSVMSLGQMPVDDKQ